MRLSPDIQKLQPKRHSYEPALHLTVRESSPKRRSLRDFCSRVLRGDCFAALQQLICPATALHLIGVGTRPTDRHKPPPSCILRKCSKCPEQLVAQGKSVPESEARSRSV